MDSNQKKWLKAVNKKHGDDGPTAVFAVAGKTDLGFTTTAKIACGLVALGVVAGALAGYVFIPGIPFIIYISREMKPPRLAVVDSNQIRTYSQGILRNTPKDLIAVMPLVPIQPSDSGAVLQIGDEAVTFKAKQYRQLVEATHNAMSSRRLPPTSPIQFGEIAPTPLVPTRPASMIAPTPELFS